MSRPAKRSRGRPAEGPPIKARIDPQDLARLDLHAKARGVYRAELVREAVREWLARQPILVRAEVGWRYAH